MADIQEKKNTRQFRDEMPSTWRDSFLIKIFFCCCTLTMCGPQIRPLEFRGAQDNSVSGLVGLSGWGRNVAGVLLENCGVAIVVNAGILDNTTPFGWNEGDFWNGRLGSGGGARKCQARKGTRQDGRVGRTWAA